MCEIARTSLLLRSEMVTVAWPPIIPVTSATAMDVAPAETEARVESKRDGGAGVGAGVGTRLQTGPFAHIALPCHIMQLRPVKQCTRRCSGSDTNRRVQFARTCWNCPCFQRWVLQCNPACKPDPQSTSQSPLRRMWQGQLASSWDSDIGRRMLRQRLSRCTKQCRRYP